MYADDLILMSISICDLQHMVNVCVKSFESIGMEINANKSACIRIGSRHRAIVTGIKSNGISIPWKQEIEYLGVLITSSPNFSVNLQKSKQKFFAALNSIFGKVGAQSSPTVLLSIIEAQCNPILLYASECLNWKKSMFNYLDNSFRQAYFKIFNTFDKNVVNQCMFFMGQLPIELSIIKRKIQFLTKIINSKTHPSLVRTASTEELTTLISKYNLLLNFKIDLQLRTYFENSLVLT